MAILRADGASKDDLFLGDDFTIEAAGEPGYYLINGNKVAVGEEIDLGFQSLKVLGEDTNGNMIIKHSDFMSGENVYTYNPYDDLSMSRLRDYQYIYKDKIDSLTQEIENARASSSSETIREMEDKLQSYKNELSKLETKIDTFDDRTRITQLEQELSDENLSLDDKFNKSFELDKLKKEVAKREAENANRGNDSSDWEQSWGEAFDDERSADEDGKTDGGDADSSGIMSLDPQDELPMTSQENGEESSGLDGTDEMSVGEDPSYKGYFDKKPMGEKYASKDDLIKEYMDEYGYDEATAREAAEYYIETGEAEIVGSGEESSGLEQSLDGTEKVEEDDDANGVLDGITNKISGALGRFASWIKENKQSSQVSYEPTDELISSKYSIKVVNSKSVDAYDEQVLYVPNIKEECATNFGEFLSDWDSAKNDISKNCDSCKEVLEKSKEPFNNSTKLTQLTNINTNLTNINEKIVEKDANSVSSEISTYNENLLEIKKTVRTNLIAREAKDYNGKKVLGSTEEYNPEKSDRSNGEWYEWKYDNENTSEDGSKPTRYKVYKFEIEGKDYSQIERLFDAAELTPECYQISKIKDM